jgi:cellulose synthase (UDP-forming)
MSRLTRIPRALGPELPHPETVRRRRAIQVTAVIALLLTAAYLTWRTLFTVNLAAWWIAIPLLVLEIHATVGLALFTFSLWDVDALDRAEPVHSTDLRLAVLIPTYNESEEVLLPTVAAAVAMHLPHDTWVLDDGNRPTVEQLAESLGARYLTRSTHEDAKAGNLNHALAAIAADVVAIFDADHVPETEFFEHTLGYFADPCVAVVQTPQDFYNTASFEHLRGEDRDAPWDRQPVHEETLFYRLIEPGKNHWNAAFWCGTNAAVRVSALHDVGGVATDTVTEDISTTVRLQRRGWRVLYHNEVLAHGLATANSEQFRLQRHRWATGGMQLVRRQHPVFGRSLTLPQRIAYTATLFGWFDAWRTLLFILLPIAVLATGDSPISAPFGLFVAAFGTTFLAQQIALTLLSRGHHHPLASARFELMRLSSTMAATLSLVVPRATSFRVTPKGRTGEEHARAPVPRDLLLLVVVSVGAMVWFALTMTGLTPLHYGTPGVTWAALAWLAANLWLLVSSVSWVRSRRHATELRASVRFPIRCLGTIDDLPCMVVDCSLGGALLELRDVDEARRLLVGSNPRRFAVSLVGASLPLEAKLVALRGAPDEHTRVGVQFGPGQPVAMAALATALFQGTAAPIFDTVLVREDVASWDQVAPPLRSAS